MTVEATLRDFCSVALKGRGAPAGCLGALGFWIWPQAMRMPTWPHGEAKCRTRWQALCSLCKHQHQQPGAFRWFQSPAVGLPPALQSSSPGCRHYGVGTRRLLGPPFQTPDPQKHEPNNMGAISCHKFGVVCCSEVSARTRNALPPFLPRL